MRDGKQALVLLPEIALTEPFLRRLRRALACCRSLGIVVCGKASAAGRGRDSARRGEGRGARSALFLPNLG